MASRAARETTAHSTMPAAHPMARSAVARLLVTACVARGFSSVPRRLARAPNTRFDTACGVFKEPTNPVPFKEPVRPKKKLRPKDPSLYMEPVPLVPDANGNWEPLVSEIWADIEKMNKLAEVNFKADLARFREYCDNYRTTRGTVEAGAGRKLSLQTRLFAGKEGGGPVLDVKEFKWTRKLAKRIAGPIIEEYDTACNQVHTRNGTWATRTKLQWSRDQIMKTRLEPWDAPPKASEEDDEEESDPKAGMDDAAKDAAAAEEEMAGGPAPRDEAAVPPEAAVVEEPEPVSLEPAWEQLLLQQVTPQKTGVLRFPRSMKAFSKYEATAPPPRNVILGKLPPGCETETRSDLQDFVLTLQIPLRGCEGGGLIVDGVDVPWVENKPIVFDSTYDYKMYNKGSEDALVLHVDFWHPDVTVDEKQMLAYFWMLWQFDQRGSGVDGKDARVCVPGGGDRTPFQVPPVDAGQVHAPHQLPQGAGAQGARGPAQGHQEVLGQEGRRRRRRLHRPQVGSIDDDRRARVRRRARLRRPRAPALHITCS